MSVVALLDRPSTRSFGMAAIIIRQNADLQIYGLQDASPKLLDERQLEQLFEEGHAFRVTDEIPVPPGLNNIVAGWLGKDFEQELQRLYRLCRSPILPRPGKTFTIPEGRFWLDHPTKVHEQLTRWLRAAAREVFTSTNRLAEQDRQVLARLMAWTLPARDETKSALWFTKKTRAEQERELEWLARLERDAGRPISVEALEQRLKATIRQFQNPVRDSLATLKPSYDLSEKASPLLLECAYAGA